MEFLEETSEVGGSYIYGRADDVNKIIELVYSKDETNVSSTFVSVVADRGTGRTTLLHLLHNLLFCAFDKIKFICMPEKFDEMRLMRVIIESLSGIPCDISEPNVLKETMKEELMDQRLLLLLDDFENKSHKCWDLLSSLLTVCKEKSSVVVTTSQKAVVEVKGPMQFYYMNSLSDKWCSMIFKQCVFLGQNPYVDTELADIGKCLVAKCGNNTLCIKMLSGLLRHSITVDWWRVVLDIASWEMDGEEGDIPPTLRVCYEFLPSYLKKCFKYCSLFPKEYIFSKNYLVHMWLSQGFIEPAECRDFEDIGLEYFDQLLSQSFFQPSLIPDMEEDKFVMPGLIYDLAQKLSKNECFQFEGCVQNIPESICHLSLVTHEYQSVSLNHLVTRVQNLGTFLVLSKSAFQHQISSCILNLVELDALFVTSHTLQTLNLNNTNIKELPETFGSLINLRYLSLSGTYIKRIPLEISNLIHLQILEAKECHYLEELPGTIGALTNLCYLDVTKEVGAVVMPHGIGKLTNLRSLATFNVGMDSKLHCGIEELKEMVNLKGCLVISGLMNVRSGIDAKNSHMRSKEHIEALFLQWSSGKTLLEGDEGTEIAEEVLESLYPTDNLKEIVIRDYPGNCFPKWVECAHFSRLVSIILDHCCNCQRLPYMGRLPSLKFLSIKKMYSVQNMNLSDSEYDPENYTRYPSLEQLTIWDMYELVEWVEIGNQNFPVLQSLCINNCPFLRNIPKFPALVKLSVYSCAQFLEAVDLQCLQSLRIEGLQRTKSLKLSKDLVGLKKLEVGHCPEVLSIEGLSLLNSLETITISRCPQLGSLDILDGRLFTFEERGNTSVWLRKTKLGFSDEGQDHTIVLNKREVNSDKLTTAAISARSGQSTKEMDESGKAEVKVYVALPKSSKKGKYTLSWVLNNFSNNSKIIITHVHIPDQMIPLMAIKLPERQLSPHDQLNLYRKKEWENAEKHLNYYISQCTKATFKAEKLMLVSDDVAHGLVELISVHGISNLVMGAASDTRYSKRMCEVKSKTAKFVMEKADPSCQISFICKGHLVCTREPKLLSPQKLSQSAPMPTEINWQNVLPRLQKPSSVSQVSTHEKDTIEDSWAKLQAALADAAKYGVRFYEEICKRQKSEMDQALLIKKEEETISALKKEKQEMEFLHKQETEMFRRQLDLLQEKNKKFEEEREIAVKEEALHKQKIKIVQIQLGLLQEENKKLQKERDNAIKKAEELRGIAGRGSHASFSKFLVLDLEQATKNFSDSYKIGEGGFGRVYKGFLRNTMVAIKTLHPQSLQGKPEFEQEVAVLSTMRHPNLVTLLGICSERSALIYEYLPNGSLEDRLACQGGTPPLTWQVRTRIIGEICCALLFLHSNPNPIVHGDLKPENILLDANLVSKLSDFGISGLLMETNTNILVYRTEYPRGTFAYMDPEFFSSGELTVKSDVYSFGITILRLLTGKSPINIAADVEDAIETDSLHLIIDKSAGDWPFVQAEQLANLGLRCAQVRSRKRPDLENEWKLVESLMQTASLLVSPSFKSQLDEKGIPSYFMCPIFQEVMKDPHVAADGYTYEAEAIKGWLDSGHKTSPMTNLPLPHLELTPNYALRSSIQEWLPSIHK